MPNCLKAVKNTTRIVKISAQACVFICACIFKNLFKNHSLSIVYIYTCFQIHNLAIFLSWLKISPQLAKKQNHTANPITKRVRDQLNNLLAFQFVLPLVIVLRFLLFLFKSFTSASERFVAIVFSMIS